ncbi:glycine cleavage system protein H [Acidobacteria bacterium Mor1]|nr:glycine cleavage system protein H [Acidobacteria bacterium Mor1]
MHPDDRKYSKDHEWILVDGETGTVGITDFAQKELGDIVFVELPETDQSVDKDGALGSIESVKSVSEIFLPVSGTVTEVNEALNDSPETVNSDPHGDGWYCKITLSNPAELDDLMDAEAYEKFIAG